jgi:protein-S-isoprenylcysteine O-methyltransferase Ste14
MVGALSFLYHMASRIAYVTGVGWMLRRPHHRADADFPRFRRAAAILMNNDAVSFLALCVLTRDSLHILPRAALVALGAGLTLLGIGVKLWARDAVGADNYYWRDFFGTPPAPRVLGGPYRYLRSPMYTVGNLHLWGLALIAASLPAVVASAFDHLAILGFNRVVEQPHVRRHYGAA